MISLYTLQRFAHFSPQDSNTSMVGDSRHSLSEALTLYSGQTVPPTTHYICQSTSLRASRNLLNYARAHNGLWLHTEVSSMNNLMIPLSLGGIPQGNLTGPPGFPRASTGFSRCPGKPLGAPGCPNQSTQMCIKVATLSFPQSLSLTTCMILTYQSQDPQLYCVYPSLSLLSHPKTLETNRG